MPKCPGLDYWERFPNILSPHCCQWVFITPQGSVEKISHYTSHCNILCIWSIYYTLFRYLLSKWNNSLSLFFFFQSFFKVHNFQTSLTFLLFYSRFSLIPPAFLMKHYSSVIVEEGRITACTYRWHPRKFCFSCSTCIWLISLILFLCCNFETSFQSCCHPSYSNFVFVHIIFFLSKWITCLILLKTNTQTC